MNEMKNRHPSDAVDIVRVRSGMVEALLEEARRHPSEECCGLLAGSDRVITSMFPAVNMFASPVKYEIAPKELFRIVREIRSAGLEMLGIYHSHPSGENRPSATDIERAYYTDSVYFIVSPGPDARKPVRAFSIRNSTFTELTIVDDSEPGRGAL